MNQDAPFRIGFLAGFLVVVLVTLYHRIRSWASRETLDRRQEGLLLLLTLRPVGLVLWVGVIAYIVNPAWKVWSATPLPSWVRWIGIGIYASAGLEEAQEIHSPLLLRKHISTRKENP